MKLNIRKVSILVLSATLLAGSPVFLYSVSEATGNSSGTVSSIDASSSSGSTGSSSYVAFFSGGSGGSSNAAPKPAPQNNTVNGVKSSTPGSYTATSVAGITVDLNAAAAGVEQSKVYVRTWDVTETGAPAATECLKFAAATVGAVMGPAVEIDIRARDGKEETELTGTVSNIRIGIPKSFQKEGARYGVARVVYGGTYTILDGEVSNNVITFSAPSGKAAYALLRYDN